MNSCITWSGSERQIHCQTLCNFPLKSLSPLHFPLLCQCGVQMNTSLQPAGSLTRARRWWKRPESLSDGERVHEGYRILICYPSHILMQPLRSKKGLLIRSFYGEFAKKDDTARGSAIMIKILWISPSIMRAIQCKTHRNALKMPAKPPSGSRQID